MAITKKQLYSLLTVLFIILLLPMVIYFLRGRFDIRPKAVLAGAANFKLNSDKTSLDVGGRMNVMVSVELTDSGVRASGVDFHLLYDANKLALISANPTLGNNFTQTVILDDAGQIYGGEGGKYRFVRVSLISQKSESELPAGTIPLANITFEAKQGGSALIKFPEDNTKLQVVGI